MKILNIMFESVLEPQGGLGVFVRDCMAEIAKKHDVSILGYDPLTIDHYEGIYNNCRVVNCKNTNIHQEPRGAYHLLTLNDMMTENLLYHFKGEHFDIIHLHDTLLWPISKYASILFKAPIVTSCHLSHALVHRDMPYTGQKKYEVTQEAHAYMMSSGLLTCSKSYAKEIQDYFMLDREFTVAYNGVNFEELRQYEYSKELNQTLGGGKQVIGFIGRMVPSKGIDLILEAIKQCSDKHFILLSNVAPTVEKYLPLVKELYKLQKTHDNFTWLRDIASTAPQKWEIMASCNLALIPSLHEPWGIVTDEWGALQVPKIVTKIGGLVEHNNNIDNAVMIEPDAESLIKAINNIVSSDLRTLTAYQDAGQTTWRKTAETIEKEYERCLI